MISSAGAEDIKDDEKGILMIADRLEIYLRTSAIRMKDVPLEEYLQEMACVISVEDCSYLRVYLLRIPGFNAFMLPNGAMFIQTGFLLRVMDDSEVATVIAHEIVHYTQRHGIEKTRTRRSTQKVVNLLGLGLQVQGIQGAELASIFTVPAASIFLASYSRKAEKEADIIGLALTKNAGYDPASASRLWKNYQSERDVSPLNKNSLFATHPMPTERASYLEEQAKTESVPSKNLNNEDRNKVLELLRPLRLDLLNDEMRSMTPEQFEVLLAGQKKFFEIPEGTLGYLCAKSWFYLSKSKDINEGDLRQAYERANHCYSEGASSESGMPPDAYREWAKLNEKLGDDCLALSGYQEYLRLSPSAWDAEYIRKRQGQLVCNKGD